MNDIDIKLDRPANVFLDEILERAKWKVDDITRIYYGKDHACRCGCMGKYHEKGSKYFKTCLTKLANGVFAEGVIEYLDNNINIPICGSNDKCYCIYND